MKATVIKNYTLRGRHFTIVKNEEGFYLAIEDKYITDGKINTTLNGVQMNASKDLNQCLDLVKSEVEMDHLVSKGYSKAEAFAIYFNLTDRIDSINKMFA